MPPVTDGRSAGPAVPSTSSTTGVRTLHSAGSPRPVAASETSGSGDDWSRIPARRGSVSRKLAPRPGRPHASSHPPCRCASSREIASPRPVPPVVRARAGSARQNRSNTCWTSSVVIPTPWSRTVTATACPSPSTVISTGRSSACSIAFTTRLRTMRSTRRGSMSAVTGSSPRWTDSHTPLRSASGAAWSTAAFTTSRRSRRSASRTAAPASNRLISSRSASRSSNRSSWACRSSVERRETGSKSSRDACSTSEAMRIVVSGVRSSWDTSETNRRWSIDSSSMRPICSWRLCAISLNECARDAISSWPLTGSRSSRRPSASRSATLAAWRTGSTAWRVTSAVIPTSRASSTSAPTSRTDWRKRSVSWSASRS